MIWASGSSAPAREPPELLQPPRTAAQCPAGLDGHEAADGQHLDHEQPLHAADDEGVGRQGRVRRDEPDHDEERLPDDDRGLGDDHRRQALGERRPGSHEPGLDGLAAHRGRGCREVEGLAREARGEERPERHRVAAEGVAPPERVEERGEPEGEDEDDQEPPRQLREGLDDGAGADRGEQPHEERGAADEQAQPDQPHQEAGTSACFALASMRSIFTSGTSSQAAAVNAVEIRTSGV